MGYLLRQFNYTSFPLFTMCRVLIPYVYVAIMSRSHDQDDIHAQPEIEKNVHRGYSIFLLNMAFISSSEVENILYFMSGKATNEIYIFFHFTSEIKDIFNKNI